MRIEPVSGFAVGASCVVAGGDGWGLDDDGTQAAPNSPAHSIRNARRDIAAIVGAFGMACRDDEAELIFSDAERAGKHRVEDERAAHDRGVQEAADGSRSSRKRPAPRTRRASSTRRTG
jgi:hypothetical protein